MDVLQHDVVDKALDGLSWKREGSELVKSWSGKDFSASMRFVNLVADLAEDMNHHPDILISYNKVNLRLSTHSAGGITKSDLELARRIDALA